jgi:outer membrane biosynthesis protein TonB
MKNFLFLIVLSLIALVNVFGQKEKSIKQPIVNGMATELPKPDFSQEAKDFCAKGKVEVEVLISEDGNVIEAKATSGDELLHDSAVKVAKKAKFTTRRPAVKVKGIIVYNFDSLANCIEAKIPVNKRALSISRPQTANLNKPKHLQIKQEQVVMVKIVVDESGKVIYAKAISGHPMLRAACETSARQAKFAPTFINPGPIKAKAFLVYKFKPNGKIEF